jgi:hypothetical protein
MPEPKDAPEPQGGAPSEPAQGGSNASGDGGEAATWGGEGGAGSYRGSPLTQRPSKQPEKKEG